MKTGKGDRPVSMSLFFRVLKSVGFKIQNDFMKQVKDRIILSCFSSARNKMSKKYGINTQIESVIGM